MARKPAALVLAGGLGLGAYHAGAFAALDAAIDLEAIAGSSIGAMNAAIIAGNAPESRVERLRAFWARVATEAVPSRLTDPLGLGDAGPLRHLRNWTNVFAAHTVGANGLFRPRLPGMGRTTIPSLYDSAEARETLAQFVDFDRLNGGEVRFCIGATDVERGEPVFFDTAAGDRIEIDHILASSALIPGFEPVTIGERLLADGGLSVNAPLEPFLSSERRQPAPGLCILVDLFAPDGAVPDRLERAAERGNDIKYAAQTLVRLEGLRRERALEARLGGGEGTDLLFLSYRAAAEEAGPEKPWDFSPATLRDRWQAGEADAAAALDIAVTLTGTSEPGLRIHPVRRA